MMLKLTGCAALLGAATLMFAFSDDTFQGKSAQVDFAWSAQTS